MDPPYLPHHHHPRYVPCSPAPPPPAPFDPNPNFYASRHHNHHLRPPPPPTPPPPPPPSQQLSYQSLHTQPLPPQPPPQHHAPYNPHHPQITYNTSFNPNPQVSDFSFRSAPESEHVSRRPPEPGTRLDYWSENRQFWAQQAPNLNRESRYPRFDGRPASPVNRYRHGFEGSSRFRNGYSEVFKLNPEERDDFVRVQNEYGVPDRSSGDFGVGSSQYKLGLGKADGRYDSSFDHEVSRGGTTDKVRENVRWVHDRQALCSNDSNNRDALRIGSRKRDYHDSLVEMYDDRGRREDSYEFNRTPRKQIQKKSALLRIQMAKPNHRSREDERSHCSGYFNEMKSDSFREKDQVVQSDNRIQAEEREGSPVELDVSFKSNALVAKAIIPSSSTVASDTSLTPKNSKIRKVSAVDKVASIASPIDSDTCTAPKNTKIGKVMEIDKHSSSSPQKVNETTARLDGSAVARNIQCSEKNTKQSEGTSTSSGTGTMENRLTKPCSERVNFSLKMSKTKRSQKPIALSDGFSSGRNECPVSNKDLSRSEKRDSSSSISNGGTNCSTKPNSSGFNAALKESIAERPPKRSVSDKVDANLGKKSTKIAISDKVDANPGKTFPRNTISGKVASNPGKTSPYITISDKVCANPGKTSPKRTILDKVATNPGKRSPKNINSDKLDANPGKTSAKSTTSDKVASNPRKTLTKHDFSYKNDDNTSKTSTKSTIIDKVDANPCKTSSVNVVKKKKVVKKVVKKVANQPLCLSNAKVAQNSDKPICAYSSPQSLPASSVPNKSVKTVMKRISFANLGSDGDSVHHVNLPHHSEAATLPPDNKEEDGSLKGVVLEEVGSDANFDGHPESVIHKKRKTPQSVGSSSHEEGKLNESFMNADNSILSLQTFSPIQDGLTKAVGEVISSGSVSFQIGSKQCDPRAMDINPCLLKSEKKEVHDDIIGTTRSYTAMNVSGNFDLCLSNSQKIKSHCVSGLDLSNLEERNKFHENSTVDATSKHTSADLDSQVIDTGNTKGFTERMTNPLNSEETEVGSSSLPADCTNCGVGTMLTPEFGSIDLGTVNDKLDYGPSRPLSTYGVVVLDETSGKTGSSNARASVEDQEEDVPTDRNTKRKIETPELELPSSPCAGVCLGSADETNSAKCVDVTLSFSAENFNPMNKASILDGRSPMETLCEARTSVRSAGIVCNVDYLPENKKREFSTSSSSPTASMISEVPAVGQISDLDAQLPTVSGGDLLHTSQDVKVSKIDAIYSPIRHSQVDSFSDNMELDTPHHLSLCSSGLETDKSSTPFTPKNNHKTDSVDIEIVDGEKVHVKATEDQLIGFIDATKCRTASEHQFTGLDERLLSTKDCDLSSLPKSLGFVAHGNSVSTTSMVDRLTTSSDIRSDEGSPVNNDASLMCTLNGKESSGQNSEGNICGDEKLPNQKPKIDGGYSVTASSSYLDCTKTKTRLLPSHVRKYTLPTANPISGQMRGCRNHIIHAVHKSYPGQNVFVASRNITSSTNIPKSRTWHRTDSSSMSMSNKPSLNSAPLQTQMPKKVAKPETSYIRKGNSLVRKASSVPSLRQELPSASSSVYQLSSMGLNEVGKVSGSESRVDVLDSAESSRTAGIDAPPGRTRSTAIPGEITIANQPNDSSSNSTSAPVTEAPLIVLSEIRADLSSSTEINDVIDSSKDGISTSGTIKENSSVNNLESLNEQDECNLISSNVKGMRYVKPRSNQLVATSDLSYASVHIAENDQSRQSDGYYKRSKNQLIRTSMEGNVKQSISIHDSKGNAAGQMTSGAFSERQPHKVSGKTHRLSKFPWVWTLRNSRLSNNGGQSCRYPKFFPQLFPWKRVAYRRSILSLGYSQNSYLTSISHKLLLLRKRKAVYTRSSNSFSLRKSKVLSVGGSSLKWSKSIERRSKKAIEEATMAVAEAERKRREQNGTANGSGHSSCRVVHGTQLCRGERIFRIGSMRYKMDSSRRTLQRISDDEVTCTTDLPSGNKGNKSYVPRRLVIGNDEYVRIGNGNQLIRDPKKRTRVLASEKVRWSLHTARQRLVKKWKYCQFFTRFGKCNKDDGKCPYIHDPSKIAVCTKFLKGLCLNPNCKLTHKVIPERMPDCSYFLQGLCTNEICPYRHVHVNPNASTCEAFRRGYCADGNECRKKHSYVCPAFGATGSCPQGSKCKLHHPKNRLKEKRDKRSREHKNARGRYFGSMHIDISEPIKMGSERHVTEGKDDKMVEGELGDYICLDVSDEEDWENYDDAIEQATFDEKDYLDSELEDIDALIKPVRIMDKNQSA